MTFNNIIGGQPLMAPTGKTFKLKIVIPNIRWDVISEHEGCITLQVYSAEIQAWIAETFHIMFDDIITLTNEQYNWFILRWS
jgi:hypothetical protein